jgi:hypothetical protein
MTNSLYGKLMYFNLCTQRVNRQNQPFWTRKNSGNIFFGKKFSWFLHPVILQKWIINLLQWPKIVRQPLSLNEVKPTYVLRCQTYDSIDVKLMRGTIDLSFTQQKIRWPVKHSINTTYRNYTSWVTVHQFI